MIDATEVERFREVVWTYFAQHGRHDLPWRQPLPDGSFDPYQIFVSELMLQQTQVPRVIPKYQAFLTLFPTVQALAAASLGDVLIAWSGLGYNRRAKFVWQTAQAVITRYDGVFPTAVDELMTLPGIGRNTASAIAVYAYNAPLAFIETNIRTVFIYHWFPAEVRVTDAQLLPVVAATVDTESPREWYWALMDYGSHLKQTVGNLSRASSTYTKQSPFQGSRRQIRGAILRLLADEPQTITTLAKYLPDERLPVVLAELTAEDLIRQNGKHYSLH